MQMIHMKPHIIILVCALSATSCDNILFQHFRRTKREAEYYQSILGKPLRTQLGFTTASPYIEIDGRTREVYIIESVVPGGVFEQAGFRPNDIVTEGATTFFRRLHGARGENSIAVTIRRLVQEPDEASGNYRYLTIQVKVPHALAPEPEKDSIEPAGGAYVAPEAGAPSAHP